MHVEHLQSLKVVREFIVRQKAKASIEVIPVWLNYSCVDIGHVVLR